MAASSGRPGVLSSLVVIAGGIAFLVAGLFVHRSYSPYPDGVSTTGTITDVRSGQDRDGDGDTMHTAVYTFTTADGRTVSFEDPASSGNRPAVGKRVDISYQPASPELARRIPGFDWFGWLTIAGGSLLALTGLLHLLRSLRRLAAGVSRHGLAGGGSTRSLP